MTTPNPSQVRKIYFPILGYWIQCSLFSSIVVHRKMIRIGCRHLVSFGLKEGYEIEFMELWGKKCTKSKRKSSEGSNVKKKRQSPVTTISTLASGEGEFWNGVKISFEHRSSQVSRLVYSAPPSNARIQPTHVLVLFQRCHLVHILRWQQLCWRWEERIFSVRNPGWGIQFGCT